MTNKKNIVLLCVLGLITLTVPFFVNNYILTVLTTILSTALLGQSWNLMSGYAGQFSFGHAAFFGTGAYTSVVLYTTFGISPWIGMIVGMLIAAFLGIAIGYLSFRCRIKGDYFALATLAFAEIIRLTVYNSQDTVLNGPSGIFVTFLKGGDWKAFQFDSWKPYYFIVLIFVIIVTIFIYRLKKTPYGITLIAIKENEDAASALGINTLSHKLSSIAISAAIAALAGAFYAQYYLFIDPTGVFGSSVSVQAIIPCIIGGVGTAFGPILGSLIIVPVQEITNSLFSDINGMNMIIYGILIVVFIIFCPNGIMGLSKIITKRIHKKKEGKK